MMIWLASCSNGGGGGCDDAHAGYFSIHVFRGVRAKENPPLLTVKVITVKSRVLTRVTN